MTARPDNALYRGRVMHRRLRPKPHVLEYGVFWVTLDLDRMDQAIKACRRFSRNRFNLLSFHDADHGDRSGQPLRQQVEGWLERAGIDLDGGPIRLLTMPRVLGYVFNPISFYYCFHSDGRLRAMAYEVTSTFKVRHTYVLPIAQTHQADGLIDQSAAKALYVSPFMGMEMDYRFRGHAPSETLDMTITGFDAQGPLIVAAMKADRFALEDRAIWKAVLALPFLTVKVVAAIHWEALKLWLKGVRLTRQPPPAPEPVTVQFGPHDSRIGS